MTTEALTGRLKNERTNITLSECDSLKEDQFSICWADLHDAPVDEYTFPMSAELSHYYVNNLLLSNSSSSGLSLIECFYTYNPPSLDLIFDVRPRAPLVVYNSYSLLPNFDASFDCPVTDRDFQPHLPCFFPTIHDVVLSDSSWILYFLAFDKGLISIGPHRIRRQILDEYYAQPNRTRAALNRIISEYEVMIYATSGSQSFPTFSSKYPIPSLHKMYKGFYSKGKDMRDVSRKRALLGLHTKRAIMMHAWSQRGLRKETSSCDFQASIHEDTEICEDVDGEWQPYVHDFKTDAPEFELGNALLDVSPLLFFFYKINKEDVDYVAALGELSIHYIRKYPQSTVTFLTSGLSRMHEHFKVILNKELFDRFDIDSGFDYNSDDISLQSWSSAMSSITTLLELADSAYVKSALYVISFVFAGVISISTGVVPEWNDFSKSVLDVFKDFKFKKGIAGTISRIYAALNLCYDGMKKLIFGKLDDLVIHGPREIDALLTLGDSLKIRQDFAISIDKPQDLYDLGRDLELYDVGYKKYLSSKSIYRDASFLFGVPLSSDAYMQMAINRLTSQYVTVSVIKLRYQQMLTGTSLRESPFSLCLYGGTSIGKSSCVAASSAVLCLWAGLDTDPRYRWTMNPVDKFASGFKTWQHTVILDDVGSVRPAYMASGDPQVTSLIPYINNVAHFTNQASLEEKGSVSMQAKFVLLTTNVKSLNANVYMSEPSAILRRVKYWVTLKVARAFATPGGTLDTEKAAEYSANYPNSFPPFWLFSVDEYVPYNTVSQGSVETTIRGDFTRVNFNGLVLTDVDAISYLKWLKTASSKHSYIQKSVLNQMNGMVKMQLCSSCQMPHGAHLDDCVFAALDQQVDSSTPDIVDFLPKINRQYSRRRRQFLTFCNSMLYTVSFDNLALISLVLLLYFTTNIVSYFGFVYTYIGLIVLFKVAHNLLTDCYVQMRLRPVSRPLVTCLENVVFFRRIGLQSLESFREYSIATCAYLFPLFGTYLSACGVMSTAKKLRKNVLPISMVMCALGGLAFYGVRQSKKKRDLKKKNTPNSDDMAHVPEPVAAKWGNNYYCPYKPSELVQDFPIASTCTQGSSITQTQNVIKNNIFRMILSYSIEDKNFKCASNGFVYGGGFLVVNKHTLSAIPKGCLVKCRAYFSPTSFSIRNHTPDEVHRPSHHFDFEFTKCEDSVDSTDTDLSVIRSRCTRKGLSKYIVGPKHTNMQLETYLYTRDDNGIIVERKLNYTSRLCDIELGTDLKKVTVSEAVYYTTTKPTLSGDSGSLCVMHTGNFINEEYGVLSIYGIHLGCNDNGQIVVAPINNKLIDNLVSLIKPVQTGVPEIDMLHATLLCDEIGEDRTLHNLDRVASRAKVDECDIFCLPHPKSPLNWVGDLGDTLQGRVFGGVRNSFRSNSGISTRYRKLRFSDVVGDKTIDLLGATHSLKNIYAPAIVPKSAQWVIQRKNLMDTLVRNDVGVPQLLVDQAMLCLFHNTIARLKKSNEEARCFKHLCVLSRLQAINGIPAKKTGGSRTLDGIRKNTGAGFGLDSTKDKWLVVVPVPPELDEYDYDPNTFHDVMPELKPSYNSALNLLKQGIDPGFVHGCTFKDEIRTLEKVEKMSIRTINGCPMMLTIIFRIYLLPLINMITQFPLHFECAVGMNAESRQWGDLFRHLASYGDTDRWIAGDYKSYDKVQNFRICNAVNDFFYMLCKYAHDKYGIYSSEDLLVIRTLLLAKCLPIYDFYGTLVQVYGTNASGHPFTVQWGSIANGIFLRAVWFHIHPVERDSIAFVTVSNLYNDCVRQIHCGDDIVATVKEGHSEFNHDTISITLASWGITFTHANKDTRAGVKYISPNRITRVHTPEGMLEIPPVTFLKRSWVFDDELGDYLAPIDFNSVIRSVHWKEVLDDRGIEVLHTEALCAIVQLCYSYGRQGFNELMPLFSRLMECIDEKQHSKISILLNWDLFKDRFFINSTHSPFTLQSDDIPPFDTAFLINAKMGSLDIQPWIQYMCSALDDEISLRKVKSRGGRPIVDEFMGLESFIFCCDKLDNDEGFLPSFPGPASARPFEIISGDVRHVFRRFSISAIKNRSYDYNFRLVFFESDGDYNFGVYHCYG